MSEAPVNSSDSGSEAARGIDRRRFLKSAAAASSLLLLPRHLAAGDGAAAPSEKLNIAGIGVGGMGKLNLRNLSSQNIVALCDVDLHYAAPTIAEYSGASIWTDYREMLEKQKDIDAVVIATPGHTHAVIAMAAIRAGKPSCLSSGGLSLLVGFRQRHDG